MWLALAVSIAGLTAALVTAAPATAAPASPAGSDDVGVMLKCGYDVDSVGIVAYYTHCDPRTHVIIKVWTTPITAYERCVGPGQTTLGWVQFNIWAEYVRLC
ncbi:DUF6355 family natural product biosynthesis protein [Phytohabitans sp. LJ34]|uniref:DUF6355 family natural product biosynthesis protein n=1 Tax=Phytohabitans sp. LJ34 TaxID=3452217 RepID=UPI003F8B8338